MNEVQVSTKEMDPLLRRPALAGWEKDITLFVACYNEEENIVATLDTLTAALAEVDCSWEILIIDDGSRDRSVEVIGRYIQEHPGLAIYCKENGKNKGLAHSYIEG